MNYNVTQRPGIMGWDKHLIEASYEYIRNLELEVINIGILLPD